MLTASFSLSRWQPGVPMNSTGGSQIPRLLDLEAIYTLYLFIYHLLWGEAMFIDHLLRGEAMFIDHLCTGEEDACNLNFELLRFKLGTSCCISNNSSFRLKHPGVPDGSDGSDRTSYPLTENQTRPVSQATGRVASLPCGGY